MDSWLRPGVRRFVRYSFLSGITFALDLGLLYALTTYLHVPYYYSTPIALLVAITLNYIYVRRHVFAGSGRNVHLGYLYFALLAFISAVVITAAVAFLVTYFHMYYLVARILVGIMTGTLNYLINLYFNFRVAGREL